MSDGVRNNTALNRFELDIDGQQAVAYYRLTPGVITFVHTEVPQALSGQGFATRLIRGALDMVRAQGLKVVPQCPFVSAFMGKHPEYNDMLL
jgi:predicted GNAT family acetyltransferase